jgi:hypothetical protein
VNDCYCWDPRDCASAEPCFTVADRDKATQLLDGPLARSFDQYGECDRRAIRRVAITLHDGVATFTSMTAPRLEPEERYPAACRNCGCPWNSCLIHTEFCCDACSHPDGPR